MNREDRKIAACGMLVALYVVVQAYAIPIGDTIWIRFGVVVLGIAGFMCGIPGGIVVGALGDIVQATVVPKASFFWGFTLSAVVAGAIFGLVLRDEPVSFWRVCAADAIVAVIVSIGLDTQWLSMMYGSPFLALLPMRLLKTAIVYPAEVILIYYIIKIIDKHRDIIM